MRCQNCETEIGATFRFCPSCGQETADHSRSMGTFLQHFLGDYFTFDSKIFRSLVPLLTSPGKLTIEYMAGRRARYIPPVRMYIFISIFFFLALNYTAERTSADTDFWDDYFNVYLPRLFFLLLPLFALLSWWFDWKGRRTYVAHFVFSLHFHAFLFLSGIFYLLITEALASLEATGLITAMAWAMLIGYLAYLYTGLKRMFLRGFTSTFLRFTLLVLCYGILLFVSAVLLVFVGD